jgi:outer membrane protein assembly factor BamB
MLRLRVIIDVCKENIMQVRMIVGTWPIMALMLSIGCSAKAEDEEAVNTTDTHKPPVSSAPDIKITRKTGSDWPCFLGPTHDSKSSETGIQPWPKAGPNVLWQTKLGAGYSAPVISRGRLFQLSRYGDQVRLTCMESETGKFLWKFEHPSDFEDLYGYDNGPRCSPVVDDDRVYTFGPEGMLHCRRVTDGKPVWKIDTREKFGVIQNFFGVGSTPIVEGDLLIALIGGSPAEDRSVAPGQLDQVHGNGAGIVAFDKRTGKIKYQISDELASYSSPVCATIDGRRWCFAFARGGLLAFDPADGEIDFHFPWRAKILESVNASNPVVIDDLVFISETYGPGSALLRVKSGGYDVVWSDEKRPRDKAMQTHWNTAIHIDGYLYGSSGRHLENAELRCIELKTGKVMWSEPGLTRSSLLYVDGHFVCLSEDGTLRLLRATPEKYDVVTEVVLTDPEASEDTVAFGGSSRLLKPPAWAAPILSHGLLYVRGRDRLVCLELIPAETTGADKKPAGGSPTRKNADSSVKR